MDRIPDDAITKEASDLGLRPGVWPNPLSIDGVQMRLSRIVKDDEGDTQYAIYLRPDGRWFVVWND